MSSSRHYRMDERMSSQKLWQQAQGRRRFSPERVPELTGGSGHKTPSLSKRLSLIDNCFERKECFSPVESLWVYKPHLEQAHAQQLMTTPNELSCFCRVVSHHYVWAFLILLSFACVLQFLIVFMVCLVSVCFLCFLKILVCLVFYNLSFCFLKREKTKTSSQMGGEQGRIWE